MIGAYNTLPVKLSYDDDAVFMKRCFIFAQKAQPHPNPYVGAVLVQNEKIIAEGYHRGVGQDHAEVDCLKKVKTNVKNSKLYVNLEPCCHFEHTPPCVEAIIKAGVKHVIVAMRDPNPLVNGKGIQRLQAAGIRVHVSVLEKEAETLNEQFVTFHTKKRPFISLKIAATLDGKIATRGGDSKWITGEVARSYARQLRGKYQAVLVGAQTILKDNPHLGIRDTAWKDPLRIILDSKLRIPFRSLVLRDNNVVIVTTSQAPRKKINTLTKAGVSVWICKSSRNQVLLEDLLDTMTKANIISVFVEGGAEVFGSFLRHGLADKLYWFSAPKILGDRRGVSPALDRYVARMGDAQTLHSVKITSLDPDVLIEGYWSLVPH